MIREGREGNRERFGVQSKWGNNEGFGTFEFEVLIGHLGGDGDMGLELTKDA